MNSSAARALALVVASLPIGLAGCGNDADQRSEANYCTQVGNHLSDLNSPSIVQGSDVDRVVRAWRAVADSAPLAIESEWDTMVANLETAITVDPSDTASMQKVADTARASEPAANRVITYTQQRCGAVIGNVAPVVAEPTTTTLGTGTGTGTETTAVTSTG
ncbi:MAG: hypothetical protein WCC60_10880 [Ilumatobacteraceae bacterium]